LLPELLRAGVTVGLGTDAGNNSNLVETMRSMYLAAVLYKDGREDVEMIPAETALEMATIKGAEALGLGDDIGSIDRAKKPTWCYSTPSGPSGGPFSIRLITWFTTPTAGAFTP